MTVKKVSPTTLAKLRSGAPEALAALCDSRGAAVYAYCRSAVGDALALEATAESFAQLRIAILRPGSVKSKQQAEQLLRTVTRRAAMAAIADASDGPPRAPGCDGREAELIGYVENTLTAAELADVEAHIEDCRACADILRRMLDAEDAFAIRPGTEMLDSVALEILTALATAAPVTAHGGEAIAVRDEALLLRRTGKDVTGDGVPAPERPRQPQPSEGPDPRQAREGPHPPQHPQRPAAPREAPVSGRVRARLARLRERRVRATPPRLGSIWPRRLLREAVRVAAVVVVAAIAGLALGTVLAALTGDDSMPTPTSGSATSTTPGSPEKLPVEVLAAIARPFSGDPNGTRLSVRVRVENGSGRVLRSERPELLIGDRRVPATSASTPKLRARSLAADATAEGTLRFALSGVTATELTNARARLRVFGKTVALPSVRRASGSAG